MWIQWELLSVCERGKKKRSRRRGGGERKVDPSVELNHSAGSKN